MNTFIDSRGAPCIENGDFPASPASFGGVDDLDNISWVLLNM